MEGGTTGMPGESAQGADFQGAQKRLLEHEDAERQAKAARVEEDASEDTKSGSCEVSEVLESVV